MGLSGPAVRSYADDWIVGVEDVTGLAREVHSLVRAGRLDAAAARLPVERPYRPGEAARAAVGPQV